VPPSPTTGRRRRRPPLRLISIGVCGAVLAVAVAGLAGGLDEAPEVGVPEAGVDETVGAEPWNVTVIDAALFADLSPARLLDEENHWLVVLAEVEVIADQTRGDIKSALTVTGIDGIVDEFDPPDQPPQPDQIWMTRDTTEVESLHPGLPERLLFLWERSSEAAPPAEIQVVVSGMTFRKSGVARYDQLYGEHYEWLDREPKAQVTVPLKDRRDES
jgi:hypothetical protein